MTSITVTMQKTSLILCKAAMALNHVSGRSLNVKMVAQVYEQAYVMNCSITITLQADVVLSYSHTEHLFPEIWCTDRTVANLEHGIIQTS